MTTDWYAHAIGRMERTAYVIAGIGLLVMLINAGWRSALGFLCGAVIAHFNFGLWKRITSSIGSDAPSDTKAVVLGLRYLLIAGAVFVIIKVLGVSVLAVVAGLLVPVAAVLVELARQLVRPHNEI